MINKYNLFWIIILIVLILIIAILIWGGVTNWKLIKVYPHQVKNAKHILQNYSTRPSTLPSLAAKLSQQLGDLNDDSIVNAIMQGVVIKKYFTNKNHYKYGIAIACYNRPEYIEEHFNSLEKTLLNDVYICIIDDKSVDMKTIELIKSFNIDNVKIDKIYSNKNEGIGKTLIKAFDILYPKCDYLIVLDSDTLLNKYWLEKLQKAHDDAVNSDLNYEDYIATGFNCQQSCGHKTIKTYDNFIVKKTIGGINMFFKKELYPKILKECLQKSGWDWCDI